MNDSSVWPISDISNVFLQCTLATVKDTRQNKKRSGKKWEEVRRLLSHRVRARVCVYVLQGGRDREKTRDDDARFNQQFVLILVGAVSPLGLCSPLFLPSFPSAHGYFYLAQSSYPRLSFALMFFYALRAPPDLFPMSPTLILWPWILKKKTT